MRREVEIVPGCDRGGIVILRESHCAEGSKWRLRKKLAVFVSGGESHSGNLIHEFPVFSHLGLHCKERFILSVIRLGKKLV